MHFPARMITGTSAQRQVSTWSLTAAYVSTVDFGLTPFVLR